MPAGGNGFGRAPGFQDQKRSGFIPERYSSKWNRKFYAKTIATTIMNTQYEGEINKAGDKLIIPTIPTINWADYKKGQLIETTGILESEPIEMVINRGQYFKFVDDDVDEHQRSKGLMVTDKALDDAAAQGAIRVDKQIFCDLPKHVDPCNQGDHAGAISEGYQIGGVCNPIPIGCVRKEGCDPDILSVLIDLMSVMEERDVNSDTNGQLSGGHFWVILPTWAKGALMKHPDFMDASKMGDGKSVIRNGKVGMIHGMEIYCSNHIPWYMWNGKKVFPVIAGHTSAASFASKVIQKDYRMRSENTFGSIWRQLQVYDWTVTNPEALAMGRIYKAA